MKDLVIYQLEVGLCLAAFSGLYLLLWRKETNFVIKRFLLILIPLFSIIIPLLNFNITLAEEQPVMEYITLIPSQIMMQSDQIIMPSELAFAPKAESLNIWHIISISWILGGLFMLFRLGVSLLKIWKINQQAECSMNGRYKLIEDPIHSFSFFSLIVINRTQAQSNAKEHILAHEFAHSQQGHSYDVIFLELIKIVQWFNPCVWMISHASKQNLEFLADQSATSSTKHKERYQFAIVHHAANAGYHLLKTQFSKTNLKNRIIMMNQPNNQKIHFGKLCALLPLFGALFMSFSLKVENLDIKKELSEVLPIFNPATTQSSKSMDFSSIEKIDVVNNSTNNYYEIIHHQDTSMNEVFHIVENQPRPSTGDMDSYYEIINSDLKYPDEAMAKNIKGKVFVEFVVRKDGSIWDAKPIKGISPACDAEAVRVINEGPKWIPGDQQGTKVNVRMIMPIKFGYEEDSRKLDGTIVTEEGDPVIGCNVIIKGTRTGTVTDGQGKFLIEVEQEHSELTFSYVGLISKTVSITEQTHYDIILEFDPEYTRSPDPLLKSSGKVVIGQPLTDYNGIDIRGIEPDNTRPLFIINGKESYQYEMADINPNDIESISVVKDKSAVAIYGDKGVNGVILITTKESKEAVYTDVTIFDDNNKEGLKLKTDGNLDFGQEHPPVYFKDGVEISQKEVEKINPNAIGSIEVIKGKAAEDKYGIKGKNGVILIRIKK